MNICRLIVATFVGCEIGTFFAVLINISLVQISINPFFNLYFGMLFIVLGFSVLISVNGKRRKVGDASAAPLTSTVLSTDSNEMLAKLNLGLQYAFSAFVIVSGLLCFMLEKDFSRTFSHRTKIPIYSILGVSITFLFTYALLEVLQSIIDFIYTQLARCFETPGKADRTLIITNLQIYMLLMLCFCVGALFGVVFGVADVERYAANKMLMVILLGAEITICLPIGLFFGLVGGFLTELLRQLEVKSRAAQLTHNHGQNDEETRSLLN